MAARHDHVLTGVFVQRLVELADELLEDRAHRGVVDRVGVQVHLRVAEPLQPVASARSHSRRNGQRARRVLSQESRTGPDPRDKVVMASVAGAYCR